MLGIEVEGDGRLFERAMRVAEIAGTYAPDVDQRARFPAEAIEEMRRCRLLGIQIPREFGGEGASCLDVVRICYLLGRECASTAMVFAMHQTQLACISRHRGRSEWHADLLRSAGSRQLLFASATTEKAADAHILRSSCGLNEQDGSLHLVKEAPVISYGEHADGILVTARRTLQADPSDQVLVVFLKGEYCLKENSPWDALGMRGTCSSGYLLHGEVSPMQVLQDQFSLILARTMLPLAHMMWSSVWLGIAADALRRTRSLALKHQRSAAGGVVRNTALTAMVSKVQQIEASILQAARAFETVLPDDANAWTELAVTMNCLKVSASETALHVVSQAMVSGGFPAYMNHGDASLTRHLRDVYSSVMMVHNERICTDTHALLLLGEWPSELLKPWIGNTS